MKKTGIYSALFIGALLLNVHGARAAADSGRCEFLRDIDTTTKELGPPRVDIITDSGSKLTGVTCASVNKGPEGVSGRPYCVAQLLCGKQPRDRKKDRVLGMVPAQWLAVNGATPGTPNPTWRCPNKPDAYFTNPEHALPADVNFDN